MSLPELTTPARSDTPYWELHASQVSESVPAGEKAILVGHSGAGPVLPAAGMRLANQVAGYVFVDSDIPIDGVSRLDLFNPPTAADVFRNSAVDGMIQPWNYAQLRSLIDDPAVRKRFAQQMGPVPIAVYEEPLPVSENWPDAPCGYVQLSDAYPASVEKATQAGWSFAKLTGGHFMMLSNPRKVAEILLQVTKNIETNTSN